VKGVINVMRSIGMLPPSRRKRPRPEPIVSDRTNWLRSPESGVMRVFVPLGAKVEKGEVIAMVADPLGDGDTPVTADVDGVVIGRTNLPLVYEGDAIFHIAQYGRKVGTVEKQVEIFHEEHQPGDPVAGTSEITEAPIA
jgi:predicted deacylase